MKKVFKVKSISIPKIQNQYYNDYRNIELESDDEYCEINCIYVSHDFDYFNDKEIYIEEQTDISSEEEFELFRKTKIAFFKNYLCTYVEADGDYFIYKFFRDKVIHKDEEIKPYSEIYLRTKDPYSTGNMFVVGSIYKFGYKFK